MLMIPEAWQNNPHMDPARRAFYEFHSAVMEPWDGPCARHLHRRRAGRGHPRSQRPQARAVYLTKTGRIVMASEVGVVDIPPEEIEQKGRLRPGNILLVDFDKGTILQDADMKAKIAAKRPYADWVKNQVIELDHLVADAGAVAKPAISGARDDADGVIGLPRAPARRRVHARGARHDPAPHDWHRVRGVGFYGQRRALAVMSEIPKLTYEYFKQMFAQVTNPPIDPIREEVVTSLEAWWVPRATS